MKPLFSRLLVLAVFLLVWQIIGMKVNPIFLSTPVQVARGFIEASLRGEMQEALAGSLRVYLSAVTLAIVVGIPLGLVIGYFRKVRYTLWPYVTALLSTPDMALLPLYILWFGVADEAKVMFVFTFATLPIVVNTTYGVLSVDNRLVETARACGASLPQILLKVILPAAFPLIATGVAYTVSYSIVNVVSVEMWLSVGGLGGAIRRYGSHSVTYMVLAFVVGIAILSTTLTGVARLIEERAAKYKIRR